MPNIDLSCATIWKITGVRLTPPPPVCANGLAVLGLICVISNRFRLHNFRQ